MHIESKEYLWSSKLGSEMESKNNTDEFQSREVDEDVASVPKT